MLTLTNLLIRGQVTDHYWRQKKRKKTDWMPQLGRESDYSPKKARTKPLDMIVHLHNTLVLAEKSGSALRYKFNKSISNFAYCYG